jgi:parallel beta-helix repeat protein
VKKYAVNRLVANGSLRASIAEAMEPRLLYSADIAPLELSDLIPDEQTQSPAVFQNHSISEPTQSSQLTELVVIDSKVAEIDLFLADIAASRVAGRHIEVLQISENDDGIDAVSQAIADLNQQGWQVSAIHIVSHGSDGEFELGKQRINDSVLRHSAARVSAWSLGLTDNADILIYGCNFSSTTAGENFAKNLSAITGADVTGNRSDTGDLALGGDWSLDFTTGAIDTNVAVSAQAQSQWHHLLSITPLAEPVLVNVTTAGTQMTGSDLVDDYYLAEASGGNKIAIDNAGNYVVAWIDSGAPKIRFFNSNNAPRPGGEVTIPTISTNNTRQVAVAMNGGSESVVIWAEGTGTFSTIFAQRYAADGTPDPTLRVIASGQNASKPAVAINDAGEFVVTWQEESVSTGTEIKARAFSAAGVAIGSTFSVNQGFNAGDQVRPSIAMRGSTAAIAWNDQNSSRIVISTLKIETGSVALGLKTYADLDIGTFTGVGAPDIAIDNSNKIVVTWQANDVSGQHTFFSAFNAGATVTTPLTNLVLQARVNPNTIETQSLPKVAISNNGTFVIAQQSANQAPDGSGWGVFARAFHADASPMDSAETSLTYSTSNPIYSLANQYATAIAWRNGNVISAWTSDASGDMNVYSRQAQVVPEHVFIVTTVDDIVDSGDGLTSLHEAIIASNATANDGTTPDKIVFQIPSAVRNLVLELSNALPDIIDSVEIDGFSQGVFNGANIFILDKSSSSAAFKLSRAAFGISSSSGSSITGLEIQSLSGSGIIIETSRNTLTSNSIHNSTAYGVLISGFNFPDVKENRLDSNIVYANSGSGISIINSAANAILNNTIGRNSVNGIELITIGSGQHSKDNIIAGNVITENSNGVAISGIGTTDNALKGNYIGVDKFNNELGNLVFGVNVNVGAAANTIGGVSYGDGNIIANNVGFGIHVAPSFSALPTDNSILGNSIYKNGGLGISVAPQEAIAAPSLTAAVHDGSQTTVVYQFQGSANSNYRFEFFANSEDGSAGVGTGRILLGYINVYTDNAGISDSFVIFNSAVPIGNTVTATATSSNASYSTFGASSKFSDPLSIGMKRVLAENSSPLPFNIAPYTRDAAQPGLTYTLVPSDDSRYFNLSSTGQLSFRAQPDYESLLADPLSAGDSQLWVYTNASNGTYSDTVLHIFEIIDANDAPIINLGAPSTATQGSILNFTGINAITVSDQDSSPSALVTPLTLTVSTQIVGQPSQAGGFISLNGVIATSRTVTGTITQLNSYLADLQLITNSNDSRSVRLLFSIDDGGSAFGAASALTFDTDQIVNIIPLANIAPVVSGVPAYLYYTENSGPQAIFDNIVLTNADGPTLSSVSITYSSAMIDTEEILTFPDVTLLGLTLNSPNLNTVVISGTATTAVYQSLLRSIYYENTSNAPNVYSRTLSVSVNDGIDQSNVAATTSVTQYVNDAPSLSIGPSTNYTIGFNSQLSFNGGIAQGLTMSDPDFSAGTLTLTIRMPNSPGVGTFSYSSALMASITGAGLSVTGNPLGDNNVTLIGEKTLISQAVGLLIYNPSAGHTGTETIEFILSDNGNFGSGGSLTSQAYVNVTTLALVNTPPTVSGISPNQTYTENGPAVRIFNGITITDTQQTTIASAKITTGGAFDAREDLQPELVAILGGIQATRTGNVLTLFGSYLIEDYVSALQTLLYLNTSDSPSTGVRTFTLEVFDGTFWSSPLTVNVTVTPVDDPLVLNLPNDRTTGFGQPLTLAGTPAELALYDLDAGLTEYEMSVSVPFGLVSVNGSPNAQEVKVRGTISQLNDTLQLQNITYQPSSGFSGTDNLSVIIRFVDTNSGLTLPTILVQDILAINVLAGTPPEFIDGSSKAIFVENGGSVLLNPLLQIAGGNNNNIEFATVQIVTGFDGTADILEAKKIPVGILAKWDSGTGILTFTGSASLADYTAALASVSFNNTSENPGDVVRQISMFVSDSLQQSNEHIVEVVMEPINDTPTISAQNILTTPEDTGLSFSLKNALTVNDVDSDQLVLGITVGSGTLRWTGAPGTQPGIRILNSSQVELSGTFEQINQWTSLFEFLPANNFNGTSDVQWTLTDNQGAIASKNIQIQVTAVNDLPTWQQNRALTVDQGRSTTLQRVNSSASDIEDSAAQLIYGINALPTNGTLEINGIALTLASTFTQADIDNGAISFRHNNTSNTADSFSIFVKDSAGAQTSIKTVLISVSTAPIIVITPVGSGGSGNSGDPGTSGGGISTPPVTTISPGATIDTKSTGGADGTAQQNTGNGSLINAATSNQPKAATRSTSPALGNNNNSTTDTNSTQSSNSGTYASNTFSGSDSIASIVSRTTQRLASNSANDAQRTEQGAGNGLLRTRSIAENTEYAAILRSALGNQTFADDVQKVRDSTNSKLKFNQNVVASTTAVSATLSIGYVIWLVRGGALLSSLLASIPAWRLVDPLPILSNMGSNEDESDDDSLDAMIDKAKVNRQKAASVRETAIDQTAPLPISLA